MAPANNVLNKLDSSLKKPDVLSNLIDFSIITGLIFLFSFFFPWTHIKVPLYPSLIGYFYFFDWVQLFSLLLLLYLVICIGLIYYVIPTLKKWARKRKLRGIELNITVVRWAVLVGFLVLVFALDVLHEDNLATISFARQKLQSHIPEPPLTAIAKSEVENPLSKDSTPSGFALRQWLMLLVALYILNQDKVKRDFEKHKSGRIGFTALKVFFYSSFGYVSLARVIRQRHTVLDVGAAVCLGTIIFFLIVFVVSIMFREKIRKGLVDSYAGFSFASFIGFLLVSNRPVFWIWALVGFVVIIALLYILSKFDGEVETSFQQ